MCFDKKLKIRINTTHSVSNPMTKNFIGLTIFVACPLGYLQMQLAGIDNKSLC